MIYNDIRRVSKEVRIGNICIGGNNPIAIQSMTNTDTHNKEATLAQIRSLESCGCDIVRITVPDQEAVETISFLKSNGVKIPIVADIHFDYRIAVSCAKAGIDKIRINPGNIGDDSRVREVVKACKEYGIRLRVCRCGFGRKKLQRIMAKQQCVRMSCEESRNLFGIFRGISASLQRSWLRLHAGFGT